MSRTKRSEGDLCKLRERKIKTKLMKILKISRKGIHFVPTFIGMHILSKMFQAHTTLCYKKTTEPHFYRTEGSYDHVNNFMRTVH